MSDNPGRLGGMNARDIRILLNERKLEPQVGKVLINIADRQDHLYQLIIALAGNFDKLASALLVQSQVSEHLYGMHRAIKEAKQGGVRVETSAREDQDG